MVRTIKRTNADDRWKVVSPRNPFSATDLESTPAEFTCSRGTRGGVNTAAQRLERHPVDALRQIQTVIQFRGGCTSSRVTSFMAHGTSDRCPGCRALVGGGRAQGHIEECRTRVEGRTQEDRGGGKPGLRAAASRVGDAPTGRTVLGRNIKTRYFGLILILRFKRD